MNDLAIRVERLDQTLFSSIAAQNSEADRTSLLAIQRGIRAQGAYVYLEIGSHLGGTIQPYYADPLCRCIYSIDKRPAVQPDERGQAFHYPENSTEKMRQNLRYVFPEITNRPLTTFDCDARDVSPSAIDQAVDVCFIDGEHTTEAVISDFWFCQRVSKSDVVIAFHDVDVVLEAIGVIKDELTKRGIPFLGLKLGGTVYVFILGSSTYRSNWWSELKIFSEDENEFFRGSMFYLKRQRREAELRRYSFIWPLYRCAIEAKDWLYLHIYSKLISKKP